MQMTNIPQLNRVIEISLVENQPITILVNGKDLLKDKETIENQFKGIVKFSTVKDFTESLNIEITIPPFGFLERNWETFEDVLERVTKVKDFVVDNFLNETCTTLLKTAYERLNLSQTSYNAIIKTAKNIAKLEHSNKIQPCHLAEAIQYFSVDFNDYLQTLEFQLETLKSEIKYQKSLLETAKEN